MVKRITGDVRGALIVLILYILSYSLYRSLGVRFDASPLVGFMQFIDVELLYGRLLESLWYYHANPPLLNLFAGMGLKVFGSDATLFFALAFHALGLATAFAVYFLAARITGSLLAGCVAAGVLVFSPSFVLYQNWLMYSFPAAALLTVSAAMLYRYVETRSTKWIVSFFVMLAALLLTRSLFHLFWMVLAVILVALFQRADRKQVVVSALFPLLLVGFWYGKNLYLFDTFSSSTWFGLGLSNISTLVVDREELEPIVEKGELSEYALMSRYRQIDELFSQEGLAPTGIPVLDQVRKSTGQYNFNNQRIVAINRHYTSDGIEVIRRFPASYVIGLIISNRLFFSPSNMNLYFNAQNRQAVRSMERIFNPLLYGVSARPGIVEQPHFGFNGQSFLEVNTSIPLIAIWWGAIAFGYMQARKALIAPDRKSLPRSVILAFIVFTSLYIYAVGTAFELAENYRYRWVVEPLFIVLAVSAIHCLLSTLRLRLATWRQRRNTALKSEA